MGRGMTPQVPLYEYNCINSTLYCYDYTGIYSCRLKAAAAGPLSHSASTFFGLISGHWAAQSQEPAAALSKVLTILSASRDKFKLQWGRFRLASTDTVLTPWDLSSN
ncbi:hypothetical protein UY3_12384 [Chelonia mydas]|uniref:Uncharacterized protein n=1 Tax=Chelonia mydas TaxID=8469 RepID=M7B4R3_CHEMY|nr:hypothetical protein UY3_12384 [Chelonia mydas]